MTEASNGSDAAAPSDASAGEPIRVLVVDDHALFRRGLEIVLAQESDIEVVGEASDGIEALEAAVDLLPDVILLDVRMPRRAGSRRAAPSRTPSRARA